MDAAVVAQSGRAAPPDTPYKGLTPYGEDDAAFFFGRTVWAEIVTDNLKAYRLTLLYGESGVGKSSLLRAGVAHRLSEEADRDREAYGTPGLAVVVFSRWHGDAEAGLVEALDAAGGADEHNGHAHPPTATLEGAVERCARRCGGRVFLILDQFEEYFVYHPVESPADRFAAALPRALARRELPLSVVISIREDAVARLDRFKSRVPNLFDNSLRLEHLDRGAAREAIERPLDRWNVVCPGTGPAAIEPELVDAVLDEVKAGRLDVSHSPGMPVSGSSADVETPYLQLVMTRLWSEETRGGSGIMRLETLRRLGGAHGIVGTHLETAMESLEPEERNIAAGAFRYLVTRSRSKIAHSATDLADWTEVPHDRLASTLERLSRGDARILRPVGEGSYEIYHDVLAEAILAWRAAHESSKRAEEEKRRSDAALRRRIARLALLLGAAGFAVVVLLAFLAMSESNRAQQQEKLALSREFAIRALERARTDYDVGLWLALAAWETSPTREAARALRRVVRQPPVRPPQQLVGAAEDTWQAAYNADGTRILTYGDRSVELWDAATRRRIAVLDRRHRWPRAEFSADGSRVLTHGEGAPARMWSSDDGAPLPKLPARARSGSVAINRDGSLVAVRRRGERVRIWRTPSSRPAGRATARHRIDSLAFTADGEHLILLGSERSTVWRTGGQRPLATVPHPGGWVRFSPDARRAVVGTYPFGVRDRGIRLVDVAGRRDVARLGAGTSGVFSRDGRRVITVRGSKAILWTAGSGKRIRAVGAGGRIELVAPSRNGRAVALLLVNGAITRWDTTSGRTTPVARSRGRTDRFISSLDMTADGRNVVWSGSGLVPSIWTAHDDDATTRILGLERGWLERLAFDPSGTLLAATVSGGRVRLWHLHDGQEIAVLSSGEKRAVAAAFGPDGTSLLTANADGTARLWRVASRRPIATMRRHGTPLTDARFSHDGRLIVTADTRGRAVIWRTGESRPVRTLRAGRWRLLSASFSPDDRRLLTAERGTGARVWDVATGRLLVRLRRVRRFRLRGGFVPHPAAEFNGDGSRVVMVGSDGALRLWDSNGGLRAEMQGGRNRRIVNHALFSPDDRYVAAGSDDGAVHVLDARTGERVRRLRASSSATPGSAGGTEVAHLGFSPDAATLVGIDTNGVSRVWDVRTGERLSIRTGRSPFEFYWAAFTPDGKRIVTSEGDRAVRVETCLACLSTDEVAALGRRAVQRELTTRERRVYLHEG